MLDHLNLRTLDVDKLVHFYSDVCGFEISGPPHVERQTVWIGYDGRIFIHLIATDLATRTPSPQLEHFAFTAAGLGDFVSRLEFHKIEYRMSREHHCIRVNLHDPDGNRLHFDFDLSEEIE